MEAKKAASKKIEASLSYAETYLKDIERIAYHLRENYTEALGGAIDTLFDAWKENRFVYIMGNGGSASTATHFAADLAKTVCSNPGERGVRALALADNIPWTSALVNDWGWDSIYENQLATMYEPGGVGIGISVHGGSGTDVAGKWSQNLLRGLQYVKDHGGQTIGLSGFDGGPMRKLVDVAIVVEEPSTPIVESMHVVLHHLIVFGLKEKIDAYKKKGGILR